MEVIDWSKITDQCVRKYERLIDYLNIENDKINGIYCIHRRLGHVKKNIIN